MDWPARLGLAAAVIGVLIVAVEVALVVPRALRLNSQVALLVGAVDELRSEVETALAALDASARETHLLWKPYRRVLRWLGNPLTIALFESYRRRRADNGHDRKEARSAVARATGAGPRELAG